MQIFRSTLLLVVTLFPVLFLNAQRRATIELYPPVALQTTEPVRLPVQEADPFLSYALAWPQPEARLEIRFETEAGLRTEWLSLRPDAHANPALGMVISELGFTEGRFDRFQLRWQGVHPGVVKAHFYDPGPTREALKPVASEKSFSCPCPQPDAIPRAGWCPDGGCPPNPSPAPTDVTHLIVHHSAGTNVSSDWAAVVRSIWNFHVNFNEWSDIGYNWLVDPNGFIYEGRGDDILGAHFCGANTSTMGVCMLGDFTEITPADAALTSLRDLLAWKACDVDVDPLGSAGHPPSGLTLDRISGHRDGCATACPGDAFYPQLPGLRQSVADYIDQSCDGVPAPTELAFDSQTGNSVILTWTDNSDSETAFELERSPGGAGAFTLIATLPANTTTYEDSTVEAGESYFYRVRALREDIPSEYSNVVVVFFTTGTRSADPLSGLRLEPNPAGEVVRLELATPYAGRYELVLYQAATGRQCQRRTLQKGAGDHAEVLSLRGLPAGAYLLQVRHASGAATMRFIKR